MKYTKLAKLLDLLHSSFWFVPTLMVVLAIAFVLEKGAITVENDLPLV
jgi:uncharacterized membrane protein